MSNVIDAFKFRAIDKFLIESLVKSSIYFSSPASLNDPLDCKVDVFESFKRAADRSNPETRGQLESIQSTLFRYLEKLRGDIPSLGVFSFSSKLLNSVMWSHYADSHRGVCLYYEFPLSFLDYPRNAVIGTSPVDYSDNPIADWFEKNALNLGTELDEELLIELTQKLLSVKSNCWRYESEARLLANKFGPIEIDPSWLKQVCFGMATPTEDIDLILTVLESKYPSVRIAKIASDGTDFGITANDI